MKSFHNLSSNWRTNPAWLLSSPFRRWRRGALVTFLVFTVILSIYVIHTICHANFHIVVNGEMYRSGQMNTQQLTDAIQNCGIKSIFNLRGSNTAIWYQDEIETEDRLGVRHYDFDLSANREVPLLQMEEIVRTLRAAPKPILIHCKAGADRAGLVSALYRLAVKWQEPAEANQELTVWYGHAPLIRPRTIAMDHSFWLYVSHLNGHKVEPPAP